MEGTNKVTEHHLTEMGDGARLVELHGRELRYCSDWGKWLGWDGSRWSVGDIHAERCAKSTIRKMQELAMATEDAAKRTSLGVHAFRSENRSHIGGMLFFARSEPGIAISPDELDSEPMLLNVKNGTLDLRTGTLRRHDQADLITKLAPIVFDPSAACPLWHQFLNRIFEGRTDVIGYMQRLCGVFLTGDVSEQILPVWHGCGANGKTTLYERLLDILGDDYAIAAPPNLLMMERNNEHATEIASLFGKRLVIASETEKRGRLNEALVKRISGSDRLTARRMREDYWQFKPTHKTILSTNHKPEIGGTEHAIWRRVQMIEFPVTIPDDERDPGLPRKLKDELPGILNWCVEGCLAWQKEGGLKPPDKVVCDTQSYRDSEDVLAKFLEHGCSMDDPDARIGATELYRAFLEFYEDPKKLSQTEFGKRMFDKGYYSKRSTGGRMRYTGITVVREAMGVSE